MQHREQEDREAWAPRAGSGRRTREPEGARCSPRTTQPGAQGARTKERGTEQEKRQQGTQPVKIWQFLRRLK